MKNRIPAFFIPHGGGPLPVLGYKSHEKLTDWLKNFQKTFISEIDQIKTILVVSAHWEEPLPTILSDPNPPLYFDYYGFPPSSYTLKYPVDNDIMLVKRLKLLLENKAFLCNLNGSRGYDHGVFIPLMLMFPDARIPVVQISLMNNLNPEEHIAMGEAMSELRNEGVLIIGSGMSYHGSHDGSEKEDSKLFHEYLRNALLDTDYDVKVKKMIQWYLSPRSRNCHPREEHLIPLMVILGAAGPGSTVEEVFHEDVMDVGVSSYLFR